MPLLNFAKAILPKCHFLGRFLPTSWRQPQRSQTPFSPSDGGATPGSSSPEAHEPVRIRVIGPRTVPNRGRRSPLGPAINGSDSTNVRRNLPGPKPVHICLLPQERKRLQRILRTRTEVAELASRARIILALDLDPCLSRVAKELKTTINTVRLWRDRFLHRGIKGLNSLTPPGRPPLITDVARLTLVALACGRPADFGHQFQSTWTADCLVGTMAEHYPDLGNISASSARRILKQIDLKPFQFRSWLHSMDPDFRKKVTEICGLYKEAPKDALVLCFDEKTGMQALGRKYPSKFPAPGRRGRREFEYVRHGTRSLLATFDPHSGEVFAQVRPNRKAEDLLSFMEALALKYPLKEIHIIWDNLNIHHEGKDERWTEFNRRHNGRFHFHYTPIHASWVNQVEVFFGIFSKRVLRYADFDGVEALDRASLAFIDHWNRHEKHPFAWKFKGYPLTAVA